MVYLWFLKDAEVSLSVGGGGSFSRVCLYSQTDKTELGDLAPTFKTHLCSSNTENVTCTAHTYIFFF